MEHCLQSSLAKHAPLSNLVDLSFVSCQITGCLLKLLDVTLPGVSSNFNLVALCKWIHSCLHTFPWFNMYGQQLLLLVSTWLQRTFTLLLTVWHFTTYLMQDTLSGMWSTWLSHFHLYFQITGLKRVVFWNQHKAVIKMDITTVLNIPLTKNWFCYHLQRKLI